MVALPHFFVPVGIWGRANIAFSMLLVRIVSLTNLLLAVHKAAKGKFRKVFTADFLFRLSFDPGCFSSG